jgi:uncharacterized protein YndB with AHSA1/START domain
MTRPDAVHGSFTIDRRYPASPARVFRAWAGAGASTGWAGS